MLTLAQVPTVTAAATDTPPAAAQDDGLLSAAEAAAQAAATGQETEATELTTPTTRVVALPGDKGFQAQVSLFPSRVQNPDGSWAPVDTTLVRDDETGQIVPTRGAVEMAFSGGGDAPLARIADGERSLAVSWPGGDLPEPELTGSAAVYRSVIPDVDVVAQAGVTGFSTFVVVHTPEAAQDPAVRDLALSVQADGPCTPTPAAHASSSAPSSAAWSAASSAASATPSPPTTSPSEASPAPPAPASSSEP
jgi:hypothetical protein